MAVYDKQGNEKDLSGKQPAHGSDGEFAENPGQKAELDRLSSSYGFSQEKNTPNEQWASGFDKGINSGKVTGSGLISENSAFQKSFKSEGTDDDTVGSGWKPSGGSTPKNDNGSEEEPQKGPKGRRRKQWIAGLGIFAIITGGVGGLQVATVSSPLKLVHYSQILQKHFKSGEETAEGRTSKALRYMRYRGTGVVEKTNLGYLANKYADKIEDKQRAAGWESAYTQNFGFLDGYYLDPTKFAETPLSNLKGKTDAEIIKHFKDNFDITVTKRDGKLFISADGMGPIQSRRLVNLSLGQTGLNGKTTPLSAHFMAKRAKVSLHPLKAADAALLRAVDKKITNVQERRAEKTRIYNEQQVKYVTKGATSPTLSTKITPEGEQGPPEDTKSAEESAKNTDQQGKQTNTDLQEGKTGTYSRFISSTTGRVMLGGAGAAGALCLGKAVLDSADEAERLKVIEPLMRIGMQIISIGGAIQYGTADNKEVSVEQVGMASAQTEAFVQEVGLDKDGKPIKEEVGPFTDARSIQAETGDQQSGPDIGKEAKVSGTNPVKNMLDSMPLGPICSTTGTVILTAISFLGGPVTTVITTAAMMAWGDDLINAMTRWISGNPINPVPRGANEGNYGNYGARYSANDTMISSGGAEIPNSSTTGYTEPERLEEQREFARQSVAYKLFDPYDRNTLVSSFIDSQSQDLGKNVSQVASSFLNMGKTLASLPHELLVPKAHAAGKPYNYNFPKFGFTKEDADNPLYAIPQENAEKVLDDVLPSDKGQEYIERAKTCFGVTLTTEGQITVSTEGITDYKKIKGKGCTDATSDWMRVRFYILDEHTAMSIACYEGDKQKCSELGVGQTGSTFLRNPQSEYANRTPADNSFTSVMGSWYTVIKQHNLQGAY